MKVRHAVVMLATLALAAAALAQPSVDVAGQGGDPQRGEAIVRDRTGGLCLLCHSGPFPTERLQGNLAPPLDGVGARFTRDELRARVEDSRRFNPRTIMPAYARREGLLRVAPAFAGKPILESAQIDDVVAFLATLR